MAQKRKSAVRVDPAVKRIRTTRGLAVEIADACGIHRSAVYQWTKVPPQWVTTVAGLLDMPPERIRPDIFRRGR